MAAYLVMAPPPSGDPLSDAEKIAFVKDGFCWPALFLPLLWALYHGLWLVLFGYIAVIAGIEVLAYTIDERAGVIAMVLFALLFAFEANFLRRWTLRRKGWRIADIVVGTRRDDYERRFFDNWLREHDTQEAAKTPVEMAPSAEELGIIGSFPNAEGRR